ncbi:hypothetical protein CC78DRAFT_211490 [Lojkania enalia]|uniref:Uncharacterized protein n=1 Tax=Lojkania enalia TaxID=147567 RepID=A0A9P4N0L9_9PLEO|nr:hypothetical protein CC78DRAFT_211490 [Didymosphaeria enalia]
MPPLTPTTTSILLVQDGLARSNSANRHQFFLHFGYQVDTAIYFYQRLPYLAAVVFEISTAVTLNYFRIIINYPAMPHARAHITNLQFPRFYWFSGVQPSRPVNTMLDFAATLPNLSQLTTRLHTAGLTAPTLTAA